MLPVRRVLPEVVAMSPAGFCDICGRPQCDRHPYACDQVKEVTHGTTADPQTTDTPETGRGRVRTRMASTEANPEA